MDTDSHLSLKGLVPSIIIGLGVLVFFPIFVGLVEPLDGARTMAFKSATRHDEKLIIEAIKAYHAEYHTFPVAPDAAGAVVFSKDNNLLFDVLRNRTGMNAGNSLNPSGFVILQVPAARDQEHPAGGIQASTGIWYDPWGSPYHVAIKVNSDGALNGKIRIPDFYSDVGALGNLDVIVWSYGENARLGGGPAIKSGFSSESGISGRLTGSGDVVSWQ